MKLTIEAKKHLLRLSGYKFMIDDYNPHKVEGAKYLRDIWKSMNEGDKAKVYSSLNDPNSIHISVIIHVLLDEPWIFCTKILHATGFKGEGFE